MCEIKSWVGLQWHPDGSNILVSSSTIESYCLNCSYSYLLPDHSLDICGYSYYIVSLGGLTVLHVPTTLSRQLPSSQSVIMAILKPPVIIPASSRTLLHQFVSWQSDTDEYRWRKWTWEIVSLSFYWYAYLCLSSCHRLIHYVPFYATQKI